MVEKKEFHEVANIFPLIEGNEFDALVVDIKKNGLMESIWLYEGKIIDGRNRYRACLEAGVEPNFRNYEGSKPLVDFVVSLNLNRRHLDKFQKAIVGEKIGEYLAREAKERMKLSKGQGVKGSQISDEVKGRTDSKLAEVVQTTRYAIAEVKNFTEQQKEDVLAGRVDGRKVVKENKQAARKAKIEEQKEEIAKLVKPTGKYNVIVMDPPWKFEGEYDADGRRGAGDYPTMTMDEIEIIKLPAEDDCILWLWGVDLYLKETLEVIEAWGFERKSTLIWVKDKFGLGRWLRNQHEYCFLCVKGKPIIHGGSTPSILNAPRLAHSEKPQEFYNLVEKICPYPKKLDYFARKKRDGWDVFGDEVRE